MWFISKFSFCLYDSKAFLCLQGTDDDVVDWSHGKKLWELCKVKYEPLWVRGGHHCNLELYPEYIRHLKKFVSFVEKLPASRDGCSNDSHPLDPPQISSNCSEPPRNIMGQKEKSKISAELQEKPRRSTDRKEKPRASIDRIEKSRKSVDQSDKARTSLDQPDKPRNSIDRSITPILFIPILACFPCHLYSLYMQLHASTLLNLCLFPLICF